MANIESNTLLEKLTEINIIKNRLRTIIKDIGGGDYITDESPFASFPRALNMTFSDIKNVVRLLEFITYGGDLEAISEKDNLKYVDTLPYITEIQSCKSQLVDNLRVKGVYADTTESLASLINKILEIN